MVSTWRMIRSAVFVSALATSVELAQTCVGLGFFTAPAAHIVHKLCAVTTGDLTAHVPSHARGRAPIAGYVCSPHEMFFLRSVVVAARVNTSQNRVFPRSCASRKKKNGPY